MKRYIRSNYYSTKDDEVVYVDKSDKSYYPWAQSKYFEHSDPTKRRPAFTKAKRGISTVVDRFDDSMSQVYDELASYNGTKMEEIAEEIKYSIQALDRSSSLHSTVTTLDDEIESLDGYIQAAYNLEILESAITLFEQETGWDIDIIELNGVACSDHLTQALLTRRDLWKILAAGEFSPQRIVESIMMPKYNIIRKGERH